MAYLVSPTMIHRPLDVSEGAWRADVLDTTLEHASDELLVPNRALFTAPYLIDRQDEKLEIAMEHRGITLDELNDALAEIPGSTEGMTVAISNAGTRNMGARQKSRLFVRIGDEDARAMTEEWSQVWDVLGEMLPVEKALTPPPRMRLTVAQATSRQFALTSAKDALNQNGDLTQGITVRLSGLRMGGSPELVASYQAGFEQRLRRMAAAAPLTDLVLGTWLESSRYPQEEARDMLRELEASGRLAVSVSGGGVEYSFPAQ